MSPLSFILIDFYHSPTSLFVSGDTILSEDWTTQSDPLASAIGSIVGYMLGNLLKRKWKAGLLMLLIWQRSFRINHSYIYQGSSQWMDPCLLYCSRYCHVYKMSFIVCLYLPWQAKLLMILSLISLLYLLDGLVLDYVKPFVVLVRILVLISR